MGKSLEQNPIRRNHDSLHCAGAVEPRLQAALEVVLLGTSSVETGYQERCYISTSQWQWLDCVRR